MARVLIQGMHRSMGDDVWVERSIRSDNDGRLYAQFDSSSWYVEEAVANGQPLGYYRSVEYRSYHG